MGGCSGKEEYFVVFTGEIIAVVYVFYEGVRGVSPG